MNPLSSLKGIIVSDSRIKLLQVLFYRPGEMYYVRQLTRLTKSKLNSVRRELENLKQAGILGSEWRANKLFYWVNKKHCFFQEILSLVLKTKGLGKELVKNRQKLGKIKFIVFSGGFARNLIPQEKEIDILIIGKVVLPELSALIKAEEKLRGREINYTVMDEKEFSFRKKNRDPFLTKVLLQGRLMIIGDEQEMVEY